jgi:hypothetical protein
VEEKVTNHRLRFVSDRQQSLSHVMNLVTLISWITRNALQFSNSGDKLIKDMNAITAIL